MSESRARDAVPSARLLSLATAVPPHVLHQSEVARFGAELFAGDFADFDRLAPIYDNAAIETRYSCVPLDWYAQPHAFADRNDLYIRNAEALLEVAAGQALADANLTPDEIDAVVCVSTSGIATPSLDARLVDRLGLRLDVERLPVFGLGCAGGVLGLARAGQMALSRPGSRVLLLVVELCGLTFREGDRSKSNLIATALFGDGAAAAVMTSDDDARGPALTAWGEHTWSGSLDVMGWRVENDGFGVLFSRDIPTIIRRDYRPVLEAFLARNGYVRAEIDAFLLHPGGARVLDALEAVLDLPEGGLGDSRAVLGSYGNMSAATVLFVLKHALDRPSVRPRRCLLSSLGPGFTAGFAVLEGV